MDIFLKNLLTEFTKNTLKKIIYDNLRHLTPLTKIEDITYYILLLRTNYKTSSKNTKLCWFTPTKENSDILGNPKNKLEKSSTYEFKCDAVYIGQTGQDGNFLVRFGEHFQSEIIINIDNKLDSYEGMYIMQRKKKNAELMNGDIGNVRSNPFDVLF
jgi:hypothetical protein